MLRDGRDYLVCVPGHDAFEGTATDEALDLAEAGDIVGAREVLMKTLVRDLRCLDAHAHLGNFRFDRCPEDALVHYEIGMRIGDWLLPAGFDGILPWSALYNRPYLRCMHGYGLCLWRLGHHHEATTVFERMLTLNPNDNQGARVCYFDARAGRSWDEMHERDEREAAEQRVDFERRWAPEQHVRNDDPHTN